MGTISRQPSPPARFFKICDWPDEGSRRASQRPRLNRRSGGFRSGCASGHSSSVFGRADNNSAAFIEWRLSATSHTRRPSFVHCFLSRFTSRLASVSLCSFFLSLLTLTLFLSPVPLFSGSGKHCSASSSFSSLLSWPGAQPVDEGPVFSQQQMARPLLEPRPGRINKIAFWAFAANLDPETVARFRSQILKPAAPAGAGQDSGAGATASAVSASPASTSPYVSLQPFFSGVLDSSDREALTAEIKSKFSLQLVQLLRQGTFVLTWESAAAAAAASAASGAAYPDEAGAQAQAQSQPQSKAKSKPAQQPQKKPTVTARRMTLPHVEPPLVGFFYDESETFSRPQASFFTYGGQKHRVWLSLPSADTPPGHEIILWVYQSPYQPELEPLFDEKKPEDCEFTGKIELPSEGSYLVALIGADDAAYFLCFRALAVGQDYDLSSLTPVLLSRAEPGYPMAAKTKRVTGRVKLQSKTGLDGRVDRIRILESVDPILTRAVVEAVSQWVYSLPEFEGRKISYVFSVTVDYKISPPTFYRW
mgnify:FL=1